MKPTLDFDQRLCFNCLKSGHRAADFPDPPQSCTTPMSKARPPPTCQCGRNASTNVVESEGQDVVHTLMVDDDEFRAVARCGRQDISLGYFQVTRAGQTQRQRQSHEPQNIFQVLADDDDDDDDKYCQIVDQQSKGNIEGRLTSQCACAHDMVPHAPTLVVDSRDPSDVGLEGMHPKGTRRHAPEHPLDMLESGVQCCQRSVSGSMLDPAQDSAGQPLPSSWPEPSLLHTASYLNKEDGGCTPAINAAPHRIQWTTILHQRRAQEDA